MERRHGLIELLNNYQTADANEEKCRQEILVFVKLHPECFDNDFPLGHVTGSAIVVDRKFEYTLLTHHPVVDKWFQFGGHSDSNPDVFKTAFREAEEESGLKSLQSVPGNGGIFDVDIHPMPPGNNIPGHDHYDIRFILTADMNEPYTVSHESKELKWIRLEEAANYSSQPAFIRLANKAQALGRRLNASS